MFQTYSLGITKERVIPLVVFISLVALAVVAPLFGHQQFITGPIVNFVLFIAVLLFGTSPALFIGLLPGVISISVGLSPVPMAPVIPFLMVGNGVLIVVFSYLHKSFGVWPSVLIASFCKFLLLFGVSLLVPNFLQGQEMIAAVSAMLSWPQFFTAFIGGVVAILVFRGLPDFVKKGLGITH